MVILLLLCINLYYRGYSNSEGKATIPLNTSANGDITIVVYTMYLFDRGYSDSEGKATIPLNTSANGDITIVVYQSILQRLL